MYCICVAKIHIEYCGTSMKNCNHIKQQEAIIPSLSTPTFPPTWGTHKVPTLPCTTSPSEKLLRGRHLDGLEGREPAKSRKWFWLEIWENHVVTFLIGNTGVIEQKNKGVLRIIVTYVLAFALCAFSCVCFFRWCRVFLPSNSLQVILQEISLPPDSARTVRVLEAVACHQSQYTYIYTVHHIQLHATCTFFSIHINHYISAAFPPRFKIAVSHLPSQLCLQALVFSSPGLHKPGNPQAVNSWLEKRQRNLWDLWPFMAPETWKLQTLEIWHPPNKKQVSEKVLEDIFVSFNSNLFHKMKTQGGNHCC